MRTALAVLLALASMTDLRASARADEIAPDSPVLRRAFVTSTTHAGDLGGLAGADAICQQRAAEALLPNATGFVAWLSDSATDAYCHVHGLASTRAANCGLAELPVAAGPWVRVDGFPFAARIDEALEGGDRVLAPLHLDEDGVLVPIHAYVLTATSTLGERHPSSLAPCDDWTSTDGGTSAGASWATTASWLSTGGWSCATPAHLACLETGPAPPLPPYRSGGALAFVTSSSHLGSLGGLAGGDAICQGLATAAGLPAPESFLAWLSDGTTDVRDRLTHDGPWIRIDGVRIADGQSDLLDGTLHAPINVDESGQYLARHWAWTGTAPAGVNTTQDCADWTSEEEIGGYGIVNYANPLWTDYSSGTCGESRHLYCLSDFPAMVFVDGCESGDTLAWSLTVTAP